MTEVRVGFNTIILLLSKDLLALVQNLKLMNYANCKGGEMTAFQPSLRSELYRNYSAFHPSEIDENKCHLNT